MIFVHRVKALGVSTAFVLSFVFACADSEVASDPPPVLAPDAGPEILPDAGGEDVPDANSAGPSHCSRGGFCYVTMPVLSPLVAVSASSIDDAWMLTKDTQSVLRWDGTSLKQAYEYMGTDPAAITFRALWAEKKDDVWGVATANDRYFIVRYAPNGNGPAEFREFPTEESAPTNLPITWVNSVWGTPSSRALWVAAGQTILRFRDDGTDTLPVERFRLTGGSEGAYQWFSVWGFGDNDVYVGGAAYNRSFATPAIAHYDGKTWSIKHLESTNETIYSLRGTAVGQTRQLWYSRWRDPKAISTRVVPIGANGQLGNESFGSDTPSCNGRIGAAISPTDGWFSNGLLVCRWTGTKLEDVPTSLDGRPVVEQVNGIWAGGADDAWIVGASATGTGGFAALRTRATAEGAKP
ncbi:MAG: hypothetical protein BGO98_19060 [Myxococcales bacterium 68-20]|nr:MAG: hypothetical protein BGO98_19060 [Myxococcales bacterium 68-20]